MSALNTVQTIVAITIALLLFSMILIPMVQSADEQTKDGDYVSITQTGYGTTFAKYNGDDITVDVTSHTATGGHTMIVTSTQLIKIVSGISVTVYDSSGMDVSPSENIVVDVSEEDLVLVDSQTNPIYALWTEVGEGHNLNVEGDATLYVFNQTVSGTAFSSETYDGIGIELATTDVEGQKGIHQITEVSGPSGAVIAPISYGYYEQIPMLDDNMRALLEVIPVLMAVGVLFISVGFFIRRY